MLKGRSDFSKLGVSNGRLNGEIGDIDELQSEFALHWRRPSVGNAPGTGCGADMVSNFIMMKSRLAGRIDLSRFPLLDVDSRLFYCGVGIVG